MPVRTIIDPFAAWVGSRIRDLRLARRMTLADMQEASGVSKGHLSNIERGQSVMNLITLRHITEGLGVEFVEVLPTLARGTPEEWRT